MKTLNKLQQLLFELEDIDIIEDIGYQNCIDIEVEDDHTFTLSNGIVSHNSAVGGCSEAFGRDGIGYYSSKGVPLNGYVAPVQKIMNNAEFTDIIKILNLQLNGQMQQLDYQYVILANDQDCCEENTLILTQRGVIPIKNVQYGDFVLTHTNQWKRVINIIEKEKTKCVRIKLINDYIYVSENHIMPVLRNNKVELIKAKDIKLTDFVLIKKQNP